MTALTAYCLATGAFLIWFGWLIARHPVGDYLDDVQRAYRGAE